MKTKICTKCKVVKPVSEFHKAKHNPSGYNSHCKECVREYYTRPEIREQARIRAAAYRATPEGKEAQRRYAATKKEKERKKRFKQTPAGKASTRRYGRSEKGRAAMRRHREKYKDDPDYQERQKVYRANYLAKKETKIKIEARRTVNHAVEAGEVPQITERTCNDCGEQAANYHHESYEPDRWLDVIPLCRKCHEERHLEPIL